MDGRPSTHAAFEAGFAEHRADVHRAAYAVLHDRDLAEDVVQDVFARLWEAGGHDPRRGSFGAYVRMMARSRAIDLWRTRGARVRLQDRLESEHGRGSADGPNAVLAEEELRTAARRAVRALPAEQRSAIVLAYWGEASASEIAAAHDLPLGTVKGRLRLGLTRLRREAALNAATAA